MTAVIIISILTCVIMILGILFFPKIKIGKVKIDSYWVVALIGAISLIISGNLDIKTLGENLIADNAINPLKILVLFISMTVLSIFLDELGFFSYLASVTLKKAKTSQIKLFIYLYLVVSVLTVFTSNDIIILSFTPFICYFAKNAKISAIPYLAGEFVAANTWSMALIIGNPTNIYLATAFNIDFIFYLKVMIIPTVLAGGIAFFMLFLLFRKKLKEPINCEGEIERIKDKPLLIIGIVHLAVCTVMLAISSYIGIEMWYVSLGAMVSLFIFVLIFSVARKRKPIELKMSLKRAPWQLIPFVISMFALIIAINENGITKEIANLFGGDLTVLKYGATSFLSANIINNIPMSVLYCSIIEHLSLSGQISGVFSTVIGSNLGAFLTPIGALAGIMWSSILNKNGLKFGYFDFIKIGITVAIPTLVFALGGLYLVLLLI